MIVMSVWQVLLTIQTRRNVKNLFALLSGKYGLVILVYVLLIFIKHSKKLVQNAPYIAFNVLRKLYAVYVQDIFIYHQRRHANHAWTIVKIVQAQPVVQSVI